MRSTAQTDALSLTPDAQAGYEVSLRECANSLCNSRNYMSSSSCPYRAPSAPEHCCEPQRAVVFGPCRFNGRQRAGWSVERLEGGGANKKVSWIAPTSLVEACCSRGCRRATSQPGVSVGHRPGAGSSRVEPAGARCGRPKRRVFASRTEKRIERGEAASQTAGGSRDGPGLIGQQRCSPLGEDHVNHFRNTTKSLSVYIHSPHGGGLSKRR